MPTAFALCACLDADENPQTLPPDIRALTLAGREQHFEQQTLGQARLAVTAAQEQLQRLRHQQQLWEPLTQLVDQAEELTGQVRKLTEEQGRLPAALEADAAGASAATERTPFQAHVAEAAAVWSRRFAELDAGGAARQAEINKVRTEKVSLEQEQGRLQLLFDARQQKHWWAPIFWRAQFHADTAPRLAEIKTRLSELDQASQRLAAEEATDREERSRLEKQRAADREQTLLKELARRQTELEGRRRQLGEQELQLQTRIEELCRQWTSASEPLSLGADGALPDRAALQTAQQRWQRQLLAREQELARAQQWLTDVEESARTFRQQLTRRLNLVASTLAALPRDPLFGDQAGCVPIFDLLLLDDAEQVTEADFLGLARQARRWVLLGSPTEDLTTESTENTEEKQKRNRYSSVSSVSSVVKPGFFAQLWERLHTDPRRLPYAWLLRQGRLCCRLHNVPPDQERWIQTEKVADQPDVELCILSVPRTRPVLAEVLFPQAMGIHQAKEYLYRELEELTVQAQAPSLRWLERPGQVVLQLASEELIDTCPVTLEAGIRELVGAWSGEGEPGSEGAAPWQTCCLEFDTAAGWDRTRAEQWVETHLNLRSLGRTVLLTTPHRMQPALGRWVASLALPGPHSFSKAHGEPAVDFVMVPPVSGGDSRRHSEPAPAVRIPGRRQGGTATATARPKTSRGGAGVETDLADPRRCDQLSAELRAQLPAQGLVNYPEAQAVARTVATLLADPSFQAEVSRWQQRLRGLPARHPALAVIALYPAQVELLRWALRRAHLPSSSSLIVEVGLPATFQQRECHTALVSLTRSHTHRAVAFGESPEQLVLALTRAASRLILFGDPGTLARRSQWPGAVDHLDETTANRERRLIARLVQALQGSGVLAQGFRLHESGSL